MHPSSRVISAALVRALFAIIATRRAVLPTLAEEGHRTAAGLPDLGRFSKKGAVGLVLDQKEGEIVIEEIVPGGAAAARKEIKVGDRIVSVAQGDGPAVSVRSLEIENVVSLIRGPVGSSVRLTVCPAGKDVSQSRTVDLVRAGPSGGGPVLKPGDIPPRLSGGEWLQGERVTAFEKGKMYLVEFWATWCGPCVDSIPHLDALHRKFKDRGLIVIGQNVWEKDQKLVRPFIEKMAEKMTYRIALDDMNAASEGAMSAAWLQPANGKSIGIPTGFLIGVDGRIVWVGHPSELSDELIETVLSFRAGKTGEPTKTDQK